MGQNSIMITWDELHEIDGMIEQIQECALEGGEVRIQRGRISISANDSQLIITIETPGPES